VPSIYSALGHMSRPTSPFRGLLSPILGITKEIMSRGPQVLEMECRESDDLNLALEGPSFL
jgi:hypothetical protein